MTGSKNRWTLLASAALIAGCGSSVDPGASPPPSGNPPASEELPQILVSQISTDANIPAGEAWVVTNPKNAQQVLVIWLGTKDPADPAVLLTSRGYCGVAVSNDGGRTWSEMATPLNTAGSDYPICGDPVGGVGPDGTVYIGAVELLAPTWMAGRASHDFGTTWEEPTEIYGLTQMLAATAANPGHPTPAIAAGRSFMAVDPVTGEVSLHSQEDGGVEGRWLTVSSDSGATWSAPRPLDPDIQSSTAGPHAAAGGVIGVTYNVDPASPHYLLSPSPAVTCDAPCTVFQTTRDQGVTWERFVMPVVAPDSLLPRSAVAADPVHLGRFIVLFNFGATMELWRTDNNGANWEQAKLLTAPDGAAFDKPWIAYGANGTFGAVWRYGLADGATQPMAMISRDGGATFSVEVPFTSAPTAADPSVTPGDDCACNLHIDDTTLSATWTDRQSGQRQMYYGRLDYTRLP